MTFKRRNVSHNKHCRGHISFTRCSDCGKFCPKDKVIKIVEQAAGPAAELNPPMLYVKVPYCVSCAIRSKVDAPN